MHASRREFIRQATAIAAGAAASGRADATLAAVNRAGGTSVWLNAADITSLAALRTDLAVTTAFVMEAARAGAFRLVKYSDNSALIDADTERQGAFVRSTYDNTKAWRRVGIEAGLNVTHFGAMGIGDERLNPTSYATDDTGTPVTITRQTDDGLAINAALRLLRRMGGGRLVFPAGEFTTYAYLERVDFPLEVCGAGRGITIVRNISSSPWASGYGVFYVRPETLAEVSIRDLTIDGQGAERAAPAGEVRAYCIMVRGLPKLTLDNIEARNSPIDTFSTKYTNGDVGARVTATNCLFSTGYRNTVSLVSGWNQHYSNCIFEKGGKVHRGTAPKAVLDIEPDASTDTIKNITFENCVFREAVSAIIMAVWAGNIRFQGCRIESKGGTGATGSLGATLPYAFYVRAGQFSFNNCTFKEMGGNFKACGVYASDVPNGEYAASSFIELSACRFDGCGFQGLGINTEIKDCIARNSLMPFYFGGPKSQNLRIDGLRLVNVFNLSRGTGTLSSFGVTPAFNGYGNIANVDVRVDRVSIPSAVTTALTGISQAYGISLPWAARGKLDLSNVRASGFHDQLPTLLGRTQNATEFRDWRTAPATPR
jgi:hypothetical protein